MSPWRGQALQIQPARLLEHAQPEFGQDREHVVEDIGLNRLVFGPVDRVRKAVDFERQALRTSARQEAERWGWAGATEQLRGYYRDVLEQQDLNVAA